MVSLFGRRNKLNSPKILEDPVPPPQEDDANNKSIDATEEAKRYQKSIRKRLLNLFQKRGGKKNRELLHSSDQSTAHLTLSHTCCDSSKDDSSKGELAPSVSSPSRIPRLLNFATLPDSPLALPRLDDTTTTSADDQLLLETAEKTALAVLLSMVLHSLYCQQQNLSQAPKSIEDEEEELEPVPSLTESSTGSEEDDDDASVLSVSSEEVRKIKAGTNDPQADPTVVSALYEQCTNLTVLAHSLSSRLKETKTQAKQAQKEASQNSQLVGKYRKMILKLERVHRQEHRELSASLQEMEQQLLQQQQQEKEEHMQEDLKSAPENVFRHQSETEQEEPRQQQRRRRSSIYYSSHEVQVAADLLLPRCDSAQTHRPSFTLASTIIQDNQFYPAMLSAVAASHCHPGQEQQDDDDEII